MTFAYLTGWRTPSEILTLEWKQVDFSAGTVRLEPGTTKNDEGRVFPFAVLPELVDLLREQWAQTMERQFATGQAIRWVFNRKGRPIKDFRKAWKIACRAAGAGDRIPHDFRRTAVRNLERAGVPRSVAMKLTGHKTESVYRRYVIVSEADLSEGLTKLARLHEGERKSRTVTEPLQLPEGASAGRTDESSQVLGNWCRRPGSNRYGPCGPWDFKSKYGGVTIGYYRSLSSAKQQLRVIPPHRKNPIVSLATR